MKKSWWRDTGVDLAFFGIVAGVACGIVLSITGAYDKDELYVKCIYNMRERTIDQLEMMCAHLRR